MPRPSYVIPTVTVAATNRNLTTLATVKSLFGITDKKQDAYLSLIIPQASAAAENYCNRVFAQETLSELIRFERDDWPITVRGSVPGLQLSRWPVTNIASVTETIAGTDTALAAGTDYEADLDSGELFRLNANGQPRNWSAFDKVVTVYSAGYVLPGDSGKTRTLPQDLEAGVVEIIKAMWQARRRDPAVRSESIPELLSTTYQVAMPSGSGLPPSAEALLDNYRVPVTA